MSDEQIRINTRDRLDDQMMDIDLITSDGRSNHYAIASVVARMDGQVNDCPDLVSFAERLVSRYNACAGMADPAAEIAELKRQRDELLAALEVAVTEIEAYAVTVDYECGCARSIEQLDAAGVIGEPLISLRQTIVKHKGSAS